MSPRGGHLSCLLGAALLVTGCASTPVDPEGTLERVRGGTMRVGITGHPPWTVLSDGEPDGVEVELVERFATQMGAEIEWFDGSEEHLLAALKHGELDLVIGGFGAENPYQKEAAFTHPYVTTRVVVAVPSSEEIPNDIAGLEVAVEAGTEAAGVLAKTDARRVVVEDVAAATGARAVEDWLLDDLDLVDSGTTLVETDHVMAVRLGENGWMVTLERFLLERPHEVDALLDAESAP